MISFSFFFRFFFSLGTVGVDTVSTAVPVWGQPTTNLRGLSPKRDCSPRRVDVVAGDVFYCVKQALKVAFYKRGHAIRITNTLSGTPLSASIVTLPSGGIAARFFGRRCMLQWGYSTFWPSWDLREENIDDKKGPIVAAAIA